eukprot:403337938
MNDQLSGENTQQIHRQPTQNLVSTVSKLYQIKQEKEVNEENVRQFVYKIQGNPDAMKIFIKEAVKQNVFSSLIERRQKERQQQFKELQMQRTSEKLQQEAIQQSKNIQAFDSPKMKLSKFGVIHESQNLNLENLHKRYQSSSNYTNKQELQYLHKRGSKSVNRTSYIKQQIERDELVESIVEKTQQKSQFGRRYYMKYIHLPNQNLLKTQIKAKKRYLPYEEQKHDIFKAKFQQYMSQLDFYDSEQIKQRQLSHSQIQSQQSPGQKQNQSNLKIRRGTLDELKIVTQQQQVLEQANEKKPRKVKMKIIKAVITSPRTIRLSKSLNIRTLPDQLDLRNSFLGSKKFQSFTRLQKVADPSYKESIFQISPTTRNDGGQTNDNFYNKVQNQIGSSKIQKNANMSGITPTKSFMNDTKSQFNQTANNPIQANSIMNNPQINRQSLEDIQFSILKDKLQNGEIKMGFKANLVKKRHLQLSPTTFNSSHQFDNNPSTNQIPTQNNMNEMLVIIEEENKSRLKLRNEDEQTTAIHNKQPKKKKKRKVQKQISNSSIVETQIVQENDQSKINVDSPSMIDIQPGLETQRQANQQEQTISQQTYQTDIFNIDLENDSEGMEFREIEDDELRSDFDEIRGIGRPSIDSFTRDMEIDVEQFEQPTQYDFGNYID